MNELFKKFGLVYDAENKKDSDVFISRNFKIITRAGIQKIQASMDIKSSYDVVFVNDTSIIIKGTFSYTESDGTVVSTQTFGEASVDKKKFIKVASSRKSESGNEVYEEEVLEFIETKGNVMQSPPYLAAMAEKRALSRGVLQLAGLYKLGVYGEDESPDFEKDIKRQLS